MEHLVLKVMQLWRWKLGAAGAVGMG